MIYEGCHLKNFMFVSIVTDTNLWTAFSTDQALAISRNSMCHTSTT